MGDTVSRFFGLAGANLGPRECEHGRERGLVYSRSSESPSVSIYCKFFSRLRPLVKTSSVPAYLSQRPRHSPRVFHRHSLHCDMVLQKSLYSATPCIHSILADHCSRRDTHYCQGCDAPTLCSLDDNSQFTTLVKLWESIEQQQRPILASPAYSERQDL